MGLVWWSGSGFARSRSIGTASVVRRVSGPIPKVDRATIGDPEVARAFPSMLAEPLAQGPAGAQVHSALVAGACGFDPADLRVPVRMRHGNADENVPIEMAQHLAGRVPGAALTMVAGGTCRSCIGSWERCSPNRDPWCAHGRIVGA